VDQRITVALDAETLGAIRDLTAALRALARRSRTRKPGEEEAVAAVIFPDPPPAFARAMGLKPGEEFVVTVLAPPPRR